MENDLFELKRQFLEYCELDKGQSAQTISGYDRYLSRFLTWLKDQDTGLRTQGSEATTQNPSPESRVPKPEPFPPNLITQEVVRQYKLYVNRLRDQKGQELKKNTQNYHFLALRAFLRYLAWRGVPSLSPEKISVAKTGDREINFLTTEEIGRIIQPQAETKSSLRDQTIIELLFSTGMRVSELANLNVSNLNFESNEIAVLGKGKKLRVVFISESARDYLGQYLATRGIGLTQNTSDQTDTPLFIGTEGERLSVRTIQRIVEKRARSAGITKKVSPHTLRHSFATDMLRSGADVRSVQSLLGHSSITTTQIYTHVTDQHLREIHQKFHGKSLRDEVPEGKTQNDILKFKTDEVVSRSLRREIL